MKSIHAYAAKHPGIPFGLRVSVEDMGLRRAVLIYSTGNLLDRSCFELLIVHSSAFPAPPAGPVVAALGPVALRVKLRSVIRGCSLAYNFGFAASTKQPTSLETSYSVGACSFFVPLIHRSKNFSQ